MHTHVTNTNITLLDFYKEILQTLDYIIKDDYIFSQYDDKTPAQLKVNGEIRPLVLPTRNIIKTGDWTTLYAFHPGSESPYAGQSEIISFLAMAFSVKLYNSVQQLVSAIIELGMDESKLGTLSLPQKKLLSQFSFDKTTYKLAISIIKNNTGCSGAAPLITTRFERGGVIDDEQYARICIIVPHVLNGTDKICGVTPSSIKSKDNILALYKAILPPKLKVGSNNTAIPYFAALLTMMKETFDHLNELVETLGNHSPIHTTSTEWFAYIKNVPKLVKAELPQQFIGNIGKPLQKKDNDDDKKEPINTQRLVAPIVGSSPTPPNHQVPPMMQQQPQPVNQIQPLMQQVAAVPNDNISPAKRALMAKQGQFGYPPPPPPNYGDYPNQYMQNNQYMQPNPMQMNQLPPAMQHIYGGASMSPPMQQTNPYLQPGYDQYGNPINYSNQTNINTLNGFNMQKFGKTIIR